MTSPYPKVSVVMPCLNSSAHVLNSVNCVLTQTWNDLELLVVDNGSTDSTLDLLSGINDPRLRLLHQPQRGVSKARNLALKEAKGEFVAFLDSDDTWEPNFIAKTMEALQRHPEAALAYCGWQNLGLPGERGKPFVPRNYEVSDKQAYLIEGCRWPIHAALTRSEAIRRAGGFDERFAIGEDFLLWMEIGCFHPIVLVPEVLAYYLHHSGEQATKNKLRFALEAWEVRRHFLKRHPELAASLGSERVRHITHGPLLALGLQYYWKRDLEASRPIFRCLMKHGYGRSADWKYMLPALLPISWHRRLIDLLDK